MAGVDVQVYVEDPTTALLTYTTIRLYSATSPSGTFAVVTTTALVAGQQNYTINDSGGTSGTYYRYSLYTATGPLESAYSPLISPYGTTLLRLRMEAARECGAGFSGTPASGTTTTLTDPILRDSGVDANYLEGAWLYRPDAALAADKVRRVSAAGFNSSTGALTARTWTNAPTSDEKYQVFMLFSPTDVAGAAYSWDRAIRAAMADITYLDRIVLGTGDGSTTIWDLAEHLAYVRRANIRRVLIRTTDSTTLEVTDEDFTRPNGYFDLIENGAGTLSLQLSRAPGTSEKVVLEITRQDPGLTIDTDVTLAPFEWAVAGTIYEVYRRLNQLQDGKYEAEEARAEANLHRQVARYRPPQLVRFD